MRTVFLGTPAEAIPTLGALVGVSTVAMAITQPDRPQGRGLKLQRSPVGEAADAWDIVVSTPQSRSELGMAIAEANADVAVVAAYGRIVPGPVLTIPSAGFLNVHFSLLPRWRGASPVTRSILAGDPETGVTLMKMDEGLDTGPMLTARTIPIRSTDTTGTLTARLAGVGAEMVSTFLDDYVAGRLHAIPQDGAAATAAGKVSVDEAFIDPVRHSATSVERAIRAFNPKPGAWGVVDGKRLKVLAAVGDDRSVPPGTARLLDGDVVLGAQGGSLQLITVQPEGRPARDAASWMNGRRRADAAFERP